jgi:hypothetical protein
MGLVLSLLVVSYQLVRFEMNVNITIRQASSNNNCKQTEQKYINWLKQ